MMLTGSALRDDGMARAVDHADRNSSGWSFRAFTMLQGYVTRLGSGARFQTEDLRAWAQSQGLDDPPSKRAWGGIVSRAKRQGLIRFIGTQQVDNPTAHCANAAVWEVK